MKIRKMRQRRAGRAIAVLFVALLFCGLSIAYAEYQRKLSTSLGVDTRNIKEWNTHLVNEPTRKDADPVTADCYDLTVYEEQNVVELRLAFDRCQASSIEMNTTVSVPILNEGTAPAVFANTVSATKQAPLLGVEERNSNDNSLVELDVFDIVMSIEDAAGRGCTAWGKTGQIKECVNTTHGPNFRLEPGERGELTLHIKRAPTPQNIVDFPVFVSIKMKAGLA